MTKKRTNTMRTRSSCFWPQTNEYSFRLECFSQFFCHLVALLVANTSQRYAHKMDHAPRVPNVNRWESSFTFMALQIWARSNDKMRKTKREKRPSNQSTTRNKSLCPIIGFLFDGHLEMTESEMNHRYILMADAAAAPFKGRQCDSVDR